MIKLFIIFILYTSISFSQDRAKISEFTNHQIDSLLSEVSRQNLTITDRMKFYSELFLDMPYNLTCAGEGPYALYETEPLVNFNETNCMVYCEHVLALSISDSWDNFFNNLQQIRYKNGIIGMRTRNHYTLADWLPENNWLLKDVSYDVGGPGIKKITRKISHKTFFENKGITDLRYVKADRTITIDYIPFEILEVKKNNLKNGDILSLLFAKLDNIFSAHMLMYYENSGNGFIRESAMSRMTVFDTPIDKWIDKYLGSEKYLGVSVMRVRAELNTNGNIILPWDIHEMKNSTH